MCERERELGVTYAIKYIVSGLLMASIHCHFQQYMIRTGYTSCSKCQVNKILMKLYVRLSIVMSFANSNEAEC